jgi:hypothetical protein
MAAFQSEKYSLHSFSLKTDLVEFFNNLISSVMEYDMYVGKTRDSFSLHPAVGMMVHI